MVGLWSLLLSKTFCVSLVCVYTHSEASLASRGFCRASSFDLLQTRLRHEVYVQEFSSDNSNTPSVSPYRSGITFRCARVGCHHRQCERQHRPDAAQEILESLASEGVQPDARCYRLAAEAFRKSGNENSKVSPEVRRLLDIAERLESGEVGRASGESRGGGDSGSGSGGSGGGGGVDLGHVLDSLGVSGTAELQALLDGAGEVEFDSFEAC